MTVVQLLTCPARAATDEVTLYLPVFEGPDTLGKNVATILSLQVWETFRQSPWPNPNNLDFGKGLVIWDIEPLKTQSHLEAERRAMELAILAQVVLWGKAYPYGHGVVVQTYVSIPSYHDFREKKLEIWKVVVKGKVVEADLPRRRYEMAPIVLTQEVIDTYTQPNALAIYEQRVGGRPIGSVGNKYVAIQFEPNLALIRSGDVTGWVRLPQLTQNRTEVVDFVGGIIRIFRGDWDGAQALMKRVVDNPNTRTALRIDAYLYWAMSLERRGISARDVIGKAYSLNRYSRTTVQYAVMSDLAALARLSDNPVSGKEHAIIRDRIKQTIGEHAYLFPKDDAWLHQILEILNLHSIVQEDSIAGTVVHVDMPNGRLIFRKTEDGQTMTVEVAPNLLSGLRTGDQITVTLTGTRATAISKK
jgi:hypothetical protein